MTALEQLHLQLIDMRLAQKDLHVQMLLEGKPQAADNAWKVYQQMAPLVSRVSEIVADHVR